MTRSLAPALALRRRRMAALLIGAGGVAAGRVAQAAPQPESGWGYPRDVSAEGHRIDWLLDITSIFVGILFAIMVVWMAIAIIKHGRRHRAQHDHGNARKQVIEALALSAIIFVIVDGNLFVTSMIDLDEAFWNFAKAETHPEAVRIEINAHQWAWDVRYAGSDAEFGTADDIVTLNDIRVPRGVPIVLQLRSVDVIHSFYLPNLRQKVDVVPGSTRHLWFTAKEAGEFEVACAQHCGVHHYKMRGVLTIYEPDRYRAWLAEAQENARVAFDAADTLGHWGWRWDKDYY
jgi:cytochrome c oxidase subunit 2